MHLRISNHYALVAVSDYIFLKVLFFRKHFFLFLISLIHETAKSPVPQEVPIVRRLDAAGRCPANALNHEWAVKVFLSNRPKHQPFALWPQPVVDSQKGREGWSEEREGGRIKVRTFPTVGVEVCLSVNFMSEP